MIKSLIVKALLLPAVGGGAYLAGHGDLPALPTTDAPPAAAAPAPAAQQPAGAFQVVATCDDPQEAPRAAQGPAQARKATTRTVTVQVPQAPTPAPASSPDATSEAYQPHGTNGQPQQVASAPQAPGADPATPTAGQGGVNVNTASAAELDALPVSGLGAKLAKRVTDYRDAHGPFASPQDLRNVPYLPTDVADRLATQVHV